jgi:hypothetical protein
MYVIISHYHVRARDHTHARKGDRRPARRVTPARYPVHRPPVELISGDEHEEGHSDPGKPVTLQEAVDAFLSSPRCENPNTRRASATVIDKLGPSRELAQVSDSEIGHALRELWSSDAAASTWNRNRAAISSWPAWCQSTKRWPAPTLPSDCERRAEHADLLKRAIDRQLSRRDIPLRERTLWRCSMRPPPVAARSLRSTLSSATSPTAERPCAPKGGTGKNRVTNGKRCRTQGESAGFSTHLGTSLVLDRVPAPELWPSSAARTAPVALDALGLFRLGRTRNFRRARLRLVTRFLPARLFSRTLGRAVKPRGVVGRTRAGCSGFEALPEIRSLRQSAGFRPP